MTTTQVKTTPVQTTWTINQVQEGAAMAVANLCVSAKAILSKNEALLNEYETLVRTNKVNYYKSLNVKTPMDLVKAMSTFEANVFGSKIEITGDDHAASLNYESCAMWNAMEKMSGKMTPEQEEKAGHQFATCVQNLGKEFGFKGEVKFGEPCCTVTFTK